MTNSESIAKFGVKMAMLFIIDGYNVIKSDNSGKFFAGTLEMQRERLIKLLLENNPCGKNKIAIVFDGPKDMSNWAFPESEFTNCGIEIYFSRDGQSADDRIVKLVGESNNPSNIVVVTNDKGIKKRLAGTGSAVQSADEFLKKLFLKTEVKPAIPQENFGAQETQKINDEFSDLWLKKR